MELVSISPGNFNTGRTNEKYSPMMNLRFQFKCGDVFYEMAIKNVNSKTINLYCTVGSHKRKRDGSNTKCNAKCSLVLADCLKTVKLN